MDINSSFPSDWLKAADLQGRAIVATMSHVNMEEIGGDKKPVLYFQGKDKGLVLNKTNANAIAEIYGGETNGWAGQAIEVRPDKTDFQGRRVDCIRVGAVTTQVNQQAQPPAVDQTLTQSEMNSQPNDEIPW